MRTKNEIMCNYADEVSYHKDGSPINPAVQGHIFLEVLLDIRDTFQDMVASLWRIEDKIKE